MTKTHVIDGKTYVEVERKADVGEKVVYIEHDSGIGVDFGDIIPVNELDDDGYVVVGFGAINPKNYRVIEPVDQAPESTDDIIANLVRRVAALESQLRDTQANVERQGVEIANLEHELSEKSSDIDQLYARSGIDGIANEIAKMIRRGGAR